MINCIKFKMSPEKFASLFYQEEYVSAGSPPVSDFYKKLEWEKRVRVHHVLHQAREVGGGFVHFP